jgi:hypothetical protein
MVLYRLSLVDQTPRMIERASLVLYDAYFEMYTCMPGQIHMKVFRFRAVLRFEIGIPISKGIPAISLLCLF